MIMLRLSNLIDFVNGNMLEQKLQTRPKKTADNTNLNT